VFDVLYCNLAASPTPSSTEHLSAKMTRCRSVYCLRDRAISSGKHVCSAPPCAVAHDAAPCCSFRRIPRPLLQPSALRTAFASKPLTGKFLSLLQRPSAMAALTTGYVLQHKLIAARPRHIRACCRPGAKMSMRSGGGGGGGSTEQSTSNDGHGDAHKQSTSGSLGATESVSTQGGTPSATDTEVRCCAAGVFPHTCDTAATIARRELVTHVIVRKASVGAEH
jgi:hypothetical protein